jgi:hypothetical protein
LRRHITVSKNLRSGHADEKSCRNSTEVSEGMFHNVSFDR